MAALGAAPGPRQDLGQIEHGEHAAARADHATRSTPAPSGPARFCPARRPGSYEPALERVQARVHAEDQEVERVRPTRFGHQLLRPAASHLGEAEARSDLRDDPLQHRREAALART